MNLKNDYHLREYITNQVAVHRTRTSAHEYSMYAAYHGHRVSEDIME
jgi:hypothetical protein